MNLYPPFYLCINSLQYNMRLWATDKQAAYLTKRTGVNIDCTRVAKMDASAAINALRNGRKVIIKRH